MSFWSRIGLAPAPRRLVAYRVDPCNPVRGLPIGTVPALHHQDEAALRLRLNPADDECTSMTFAGLRVVLHWMDGLIDAVCFYSLDEARAYAGFAPSAAAASRSDYDHFAYLVRRGNHVFNEPPAYRPSFARARAA